MATSTVKQATCKAHPVQGLVCAHGYKDTQLKTLPVESVFVSISVLEALVTFTWSTTSDPSVIKFLGQDLPVKWHERMTCFVNRIMAMFSLTGSYRIDIEQNFASGIGVGSSAAVYAALTKSIVNAAGIEVSNRELSALARLGSYSAAAAIVGNVSVIRTGTSHADSVAEVICLAENFPYRLLVLPVGGEKLSEEIHADIISSPFYEVWLRRAKALSKDVVSMLSTGKIDALGSKVEAYIYENYAAICTGSMNLLSWKAETLQRLELLRNFRVASGLTFFISMNSGPAVFVYVEPDHAPIIISYLKEAKVECLVSDVGGATYCGSATFENH